jgi:parallel beta-helix repeat protein
VYGKEQILILNFNHFLSIIFIWKKIYIMINSLILYWGRKKMKKYSLVRNYLTIGVIVFFIGTSIVPSIQSNIPSKKNVITVDDEPGDADFTSLKDAMNASSPGDTIEVYSGMYFEQEIHILNNNVSLLGIAQELGDGNDSGRPFIQGNVSLGVVLRVEANHVIISNLNIENVKGFDAGCIRATEQNNLTISYCIIHTLQEGYNSNPGIYVYGDNIRIIDNEVSYCNPGIHVGTEQPGSITITGNIVTDCGYYGGIYLSGDEQNISGNSIKRCEKGINIHGKNNIIFGNDIESCQAGVLNYEGSNNIISGNNINFCPIGFLNEWGGGNRIINNNFKQYNHSWNEPWWMRQMVIPYEFDKKDTWRGNYWDTLTGIASKKILGAVFVGFVIFPEFGWGFVLPIPWAEYDWHPAKEPYDIP